MSKNWKVDLLENCKICNKPLIYKRMRSYCSKTCRYKFYNKKYRKYNNEWQRNQRGKYTTGKLRCGLCDKWYTQIITHVIQHHKITGEEYREEFDLPMRGIIPAWYREIKGDQALDNGTYKNLKKGILTRYTPDDPKAKIVTGWKGRTGRKGYTPTELAE